MGRQFMLYYHLPLRYTQENGNWSDNTPLYADPEYTQLVGDMSSMSSIVYATTDTDTPTIVNNHPQRLHPLYKSNKLIEIYNNSNNTNIDHSIQKRRYFHIEYIADTMFPIAAKINHKQGFPNLKKVTRVIRRVEPKEAEKPRCHSMLVCEV
jgi:hypothetical protein